MSSVTFSTGFHQIKPGLRVSGDEISVVYKSTYDSGLYAGKKYIHIDLTNETDLTFVEAGIAGPFDTIPDVDALYQQLLDAGMTEAFEGFLVDPSDMSVISVEGNLISFDFAGHQPYVFGRADDPAVTERVKVAHQTWTLPQSDFAGAATLFASLEGPEELEFRSIEARFATQENEFDADILEVKGLLDDEIGARTNADAALQSAIDINTAGLATEINQRQAGDTATESAANAYTDTKINDLVNGAGPALDTLKELEDALTSNDSEIAALVTAVGNAQAAADANTTGLATEINQRQAGDNALSGRLDVLEADPITNAEVVTIANDLQANRIQGDAVLSADLNTEEFARVAADNALDARITAIEDAPYATDAGVTIVANDIRTDFENADTSEANARIAGDASTLSSANTYTDTKVSDLVNGAGAALDTLKELGDALTDNDNEIAALVTQIGTVESGLAQEVTDRTNGDSALDTRVAALELDPVTFTQVTGAISAESTSRSNADTALGNRLTSLEADPTTKTYVDTQDALALPKAGAVVSTGSDVTFRYGDKLIIDSAVELNLWSDGDVKIVPEEDSHILLSTQASGRTKVSNGLEVTGDIDLTGNFIGSGSFTCGGLVVNDVGSFSSPAVPDNVTFAALVEAIGDALVARPKLDGTNIPGPYADDAAAATGGVAVGAIYKKTNGQIHWRVS